MGLFSKAKSTHNSQTANPPQRSFARKALRFAFNPEVGDQLRPMQESTEIFVNLLAMIFIAMKMFPADHPAYRGIHGARLTLPLLIGTVWRDLKFTRQNVPQILIFFAFIASCIFAGVAVFVLLMSIFGTAFVGKAHAAGFFEPAPDDIALQWINFLRSGSVTGDFFTGFAQPLMWAGGIQGALIVALGFYSDAILIVAAVILFYHLAAMTVETAHEGVVMGKRANQIWAPIRLVVAIGLLVPIGGGLNSGQYIVFKVTEWGSGLASQVWSIFLSGFAKGDGVASVPQYAADVVYNTLLTEACSQAYNAYQCGSGPGTIQAGDPNAKSCKKIQQHGGKLPTTRAEEDLVNPLNSQVCGQYGFNLTGIGNCPTMLFSLAQGQACFFMMDSAVADLAAELIKHKLPKDVGGDSDQKTPPYSGKLDAIIMEYMMCLGADLPTPKLDGVFAQSADWGWLSSGAVLSSISQAESCANELGGMIPNTQAPDFNSGDTLMKKALEVAAWVGRYVQMIGDGSAGAMAGGIVGGDMCAVQRGFLLAEANDMRNQGVPRDHFLDRIFQIIDWYASWNCVWLSMPSPLDMILGGGNFTMGIMFNGANPLAEMARLGEACLNTAYDAFDDMVKLSATAGADAAGKKAEAGLANKGGASSLLGLQGDIQQGQVTFISSILGIIVSVFFTSGILLAYYVPLIPFISFLFSAMSWVLAVLEAVIAVPLFALAHLTIEGPGLPGSAAKAGYYFIFHIALKPVLMVFGLVVGLIVFYAAVSYMNLFYMMAISTSGGLATSHLFLSRFVYNGLYVIIIYLSANASFKAIHLVPEHAMKWMGGQTYHFAHMGEAQQVVGPLMQGAGNISQVTSALTQGGPSAAKLLLGQK